MKIAEVQQKARNIGFDPVKMKKDDLIRMIQTREGNSACFKTNQDNCVQYNCCWRDDCKPH